MANPPFNLDITDPADNAVTANFPANERNFRDQVNSYLNTEHDPNTGYHKFQVLTQTQINSLSSPPTGMLVFNSSIGGVQCNVGTPASPTWTTIGAQSGDVKPWTTNTAPTGWLICDGSAVSRTTFATLFNLISTTYGAGDGSTTFNVPDMRGRTVAGFDSGNASGRLTASTAQGVSASTIGNTGGEQAHTLSTPEIPSHTHANTLSDPGHSHSVQVSVSTLSTGSNAGSTDVGNPGTTGTATTGITINNAAAGGGSSHNVVQPTIVLNWVIKT